MAFAKQHTNIQSCGSIVEHLMSLVSILRIPSITVCNLQHFLQIESVETGTRFLLFAALMNCMVHGENDNQGKEFRITLNAVKRKWITFEKALSFFQSCNICCRCNTCAIDYIGGFLTVHVGVCLFFYTDEHTSLTVRLWMAEM